MNANLSELNKPSFIFHPLKRLLYNKIVKDINIAIKIMEPKENELKPIFIVNNESMIVYMTYCYNKTGDLIYHRNLYVFNGYNNLSKERNLNEFKSLIIDGNVNPSIVTKIL